MENLLLIAFLTLLSLGNTNQFSIEPDYDESEVCQSAEAKSMFECCYTKWIDGYNGEVNDHSKCTFYNNTIDELESETVCTAGKDWEASEKSCETIDPVLGHWQLFNGKPNRLVSTSYFFTGLFLAWCAMPDSSGHVPLYWNCSIDSVQAEVSCDPPPNEIEVCKDGLFNVTCTASGFPSIVTSWVWNTNDDLFLLESRTVTVTQDGEDGMYTLEESAAFRLTGKYPSRPLRLDVFQQSWNYQHFQYYINDKTCSDPPNGSPSKHTVLSILIPVCLMVLWKI